MRSISNTGDGMVDGGSQALKTSAYKPVVVVVGNSNELERARAKVEFLRFFANEIFSRYVVFIIPLNSAAEVLLLRRLKGV